MRLRPSALIAPTAVRVALAALAFFVPATGRAAEYRDALDDFSANIDPPGFIACVTYPVERWDKIDCDGLNQAFEAGVRRQIPHDVILIGSAVHRADTWGFRVNVTRLPWDAPPLNDTEDAPYLRNVRAIVEAQVAESKAVLAASGIDVRMETIGDVHAVRIAYETQGDPGSPPEAVVELGVLGAHAVFGIELIGARSHAQELAVIADRAVRSVRVHPAPRRPPLLALIATIAVGVFGVVGTFILVSTLLGTRRKRPSHVAWPGTRG